MTALLALATGLAALLVSALGGWPLTAAVLSAVVVPEEVAEGTPDTTLRGGTWIGILERLAVTGCLIAGYPAGIAFVIAVKGLGRYPELRENPGASERFVIGTLTSLLWAVAVGAAMRLLLT